MVWVIAFGELFFGDLWCVVWGYGGMRTHFSLLNPELLQVIGVRMEPRWNGDGPNMENPWIPPMAQVSWLH